MRICDWSSDVCSSDLQACNGVRLAGFMAVDDRFLRQVIRDAPGHCASVACGNDIRLGSLELVPEQLAEEVVVAIPIDRKSAVEGERVAARVDLGGPHILKKKNNTK